MVVLDGVGFCNSSGPGTGDVGVEKDGTVRIDVWIED